MNYQTLRCSRFWPVLRDSVIVVVAASGVALLVNTLRAKGIPLVASKPYETMVPCPVPTGPAQPLAASAIVPGGKGDCLVDARAARLHRIWHARGALSVPFDWLDPTPKRLIRAILERRARRVIVYGDGGNPDSGEQLAKEIASKNIKNVYFVRGGAPALMKSLRPRRPAPGVDRPGTGTGAGTGRPGTKAAGAGKAAVADEGAPARERTLQDGGAR